MKPALKRLRLLRESGSLSSADLDRRLTEEAFRRFEKGVIGGIWYPLAIQNEFLSLIREVEGGGRDDFLIEFGKQTADEVASTAGIRLVINGARTLKLPVGKTLILMSAVGFNFGSWEFVGDDMKDFSVIGRAVQAMPNTICLNICGFIEQFASTWNEREMACTCVRVAGVEIHFHVSPNETRNL